MVDESGKPSSVLQLLSSIDTKLDGIVSSVTNLAALEEKVSGYQSTLDQIKSEMTVLQNNSSANMLSALMAQVQQIRTDLEGEVAPLPNAPPQRPV